MDSWTKTLSLITGNVLSCMNSLMPSSLKGIRTMELQEHKQEAFNHTVAQMRKQGWTRSRVQGADRCLYLDSRGRRCAVGALLSETTARKWGSKGLSYIQDRSDSEVLALIKRLGINFLGSLQSAHDRGRSPKLMEQNFRQLARDYDLTFPEETNE